MKLVYIWLFLSCKKTTKKEMRPDAELLRRWMELSEEVTLEEDATENHSTSVRQMENNTSSACVWRDLHLAAWNGNTHLVKQLLKRGAMMESR